MKQSINHQISTVLILIVSLILFATSCTSSKKSSIAWVNSMKSECSTGADEMQCLSIHRGDVLENPNWEIVQAEINGFNFEPGFFQKIEFKEEEAGKSKLSQDNALPHYNLIKVLDKKIDKRFILNDIWALNRIAGNAVNDSLSIPTMEINLKKMRVSGTNGCNNYTGKIENITSSEIKFGRIGSTRKMCLDMNLSNSYDRALSNSQSYKLGKLELTLLDVDGNETLNFRKVD